ncbi:MAG: radical SAM protein [Nitrospinae bacterium]|nr:radical SAM protein [Nitrospinota bacterium]
MERVLKRGSRGAILSPESILSSTREKFQQVLKEARPLFGWFSLTESCDLRCRYCFAGSSRPLEEELTTQEVLQVVDNIAEAGTEAIVFGGGEPTLRKDLVEIVAHASRRMAVAINTNGQLMEPESVRRLARAGLSQLKVSVDGLQDLHDWNRGAGTFEKALNALKEARAAGIPRVILIATISQLNYPQLAEMVRLAMEQGVDFSAVEFLPLGRGTSGQDWGLTPEQTRDMQRYLTEARRLHGSKRIIFENRYIIAEDEHAQRICADPQRPTGVFDFCVGCPNGIYQYCINAEGKVTAGDITTLEIGDLKRERLGEIWRNSEVLHLLRDREQLKGKCGECEYRYICGGCRRRAYTYTGDLMAEDPGCWRSPLRGD